MNKIIEYTPNIIGEAAKSPLGLFALMIITLSIVGFFFFRDSSEGTRTGMFVLMFIGVVSFGAATFRTTSYIVPTQPSNRLTLQDDQPANTTATDAVSTNRDKPTWLRTNEIRGAGVRETISYWYTFNAGPGEVKVTLDGNAKGGPGPRIEISDLDAKKLLNMGTRRPMGIEKRAVERFQLGRRQQVVLRVLLDEHTTYYMVRLEGAIDFTPTARNG
jgi:hypothetical protein